MSCQHTVHKDERHETGVRGHRVPLPVSPLSRSRDTDRRQLDGFPTPRDWLAQTFWTPLRKRRKKRKRKKSHWCLLVSFDLRNWRVTSFHWRHHVVLMLVWFGTHCCLCVCVFVWGVHGDPYTVFTRQRIMALEARAFFWLTGVPPRPVSLSISISVCLYLCLCLVVYLCLCLYFSVPVCVCVSLSVFLSPCVSLCLFVFVPVCVCVCVSLSLSDFVWPCVCPYVFVYISLTLCMWVSFSMCVSVCLSFSFLFFCRYVSLSVFLCLCLSVSVSLFVFLCPCVCVSLSLSPSVSYLWFCDLRCALLWLHIWLGVKYQEPRTYSLLSFSITDFRNLETDTLDNRFFTVSFCDSSLAHRRFLIIRFVAALCE